MLDSRYPRVDIISKIVGFNPALQFSRIRGPQIERSIIKRDVIVNISKYRFHV